MALNNDVDKHKQTLPGNNMSQHEKNIISKFPKWEDLVFSQADKGRPAIILYAEDYIEKANKY